MKSKAKAVKAQSKAKKKLKKRLLKAY